MLFIYFFREIMFVLEFVFVFDFQEIMYYDFVEENCIVIFYSFKRI